MESLYNNSQNKEKNISNREMKKSPRQIIEEGIQRSTKINDEKTIAVLAEKALRAESCAKTKGYDSFLFNIAESLESVRCGTTSENEYFSWINEANHIMKRMLDGHVNATDLDVRNHFIEMSWQRETELLTCLALYEQSDNPLAKKRYNELRIKLVRLRQIRSALMVNTKNTVDKDKLSPTEQTRLRNTIKTLEEMEEYDENGDYNNQKLLEQLRALRISHEQDFEFYRGYSYYTRMLEEERRLKANANTYNRQNMAVLFAEMKQENESKEDVRQRIFRLTGRKLQEHSKTKPGEQQRINAFNANIYRQLRQARDYQSEDD